MSSTIKVNNIQNLAGDDSGIDLSTNDQIILKTANTTALTINSSQVANFANNPTVNSVPYTNTPAFLAKLSANQTLTDATVTKIEFDTEVYDTDGKYDHSTNYRFTPTVAGTYFFYIQIHGLSNANAEVGDIVVSLKKNGTDIYSSRGNYQNNRPNQVTHNISVTDVANTTDYYEVFVYFDDQSGNPDVDASIGGLFNDTVPSFFGAYKLIGL